MRLTPEEMQAVVNLRANNDFKVFLRALGNEGENLVRQLIYEKSQVSVMQGRVQQMTEILDAIAEAPKALEATFQPRT